MKHMEKILFIPDTHVPYHDKQAFELVLQAAAGFKPDIVVILGDFIDCYCVSSHSKDPTRANQLEYEVGQTKKALQQVADLGARKMYFVAGNHEDRLERYLKDEAPALYNLINIPKLLDLGKLGFEYVPYKKSMRIGKLNVTHDTGTAGRYAHYKSLDAFQGNVVIGHTHRLGYAVEGNSQGSRYVATMLGWLGDVSKVDYMHEVKAVKDWSLAFGIGYKEKSGTVHVVPVPIIDYTCQVEGKLYKVGGR